MKLSKPVLAVLALGLSTPAFVPPGKHEDRHHPETHSEKHEAQNFVGRATIIVTSTSSSTSFVRSM